MESWITLLAAILGFLATMVAVVGEIMRRRDKSSEKNKVVVQVVYPPDYPYAPGVKPPMDAHAGTPLPETVLGKVQKDGDVGKIKQPLPEEQTAPLPSKPQELAREEVALSAPLHPENQESPREAEPEPDKSKMQVGFVGDAFKLNAQDVEASVKSLPESWGRKYAVVIQGKKYAPKEVIQAVMQQKSVPLASSDFNTNQAVGILKKLGFSVLEKEPEVLPSAAVAPQEPGDPPKVRRMQGQFSLDAFAPSPAAEAQPEKQVNDSVSSAPVLSPLFLQPEQTVANTQPVTREEKGENASQATEKPSKRLKRMDISPLFTGDAKKE
jgi:hypothetical protein